MDMSLQEMFEYFYKDLFDPEFTSTHLLHKIIVSLIIIFVSIWLYRFIKKMMHQFIKNIKVLTVLQVTTRNVFIVIASLLLLSTWVNVKNSVLLVLILFLGMMIFSIKNLSNNLVAWLMLLRKKYFHLYDRIEIDGMVGDVIKITPFYFKMVERGNDLSSATATGRIIHVPNHILLNNKLYNYNQLLPINWKEVRFSITIDSNWESALAVVEEVGHAYMEDFLSQYSEGKLQSYRARASLFDEELRLKTYVQIDEGIVLVAQVPVHYASGATVQSDLNKKIISKLQDLKDVELNDITTHIHIDNLQDLARSEKKS